MNFCTVCIKPFRLWTNQKTSRCDSCNALAFKEKCRPTPQKFRHRKKIRKNIHVRTYREKALEYYGRECSTCGFGEHELLLDVHHLDEDRSHNDLENLAVLCVMCHARITRLEETVESLKAAARSSTDAFGASASDPEPSPPEE